MRLRHGQRRHHRDDGRRRLDRPRARSPLFVEALIDGADFAKGTRYLPDGGSEDITFIRRSGNAGLTGLVNLLFGARYTDLCYGYNAFWRDCLTSLNLDSTGFEIETPAQPAERSRSAWPSRRCRAWSATASTARATSTPSVTGCGSCGRSSAERLSPLHAPGPAWAALTGQLQYEEADEVVTINGDVAMPHLLDRAIDA